MKKRYVYEYRVKSTQNTGSFSVVTTSKEQADIDIVERVADMEFVEETDIEIVRLITELDPEKRYYECAGCT